MIHIGIDPGLSGALAFIFPDGRVAIEDFPTVELPGNGLVCRRIDGRALVQLVRQHCPATETVSVVCEAVMVMGGKNNAAQTQGSLMRSLGAIEAVFDALRWPCQMVAPMKWQAFYGLAGKKREERGPGELPAAIVKARTLYPGVVTMLSRVKDHNRAEALLVAHFGKQVMA